MKMYAQQPVADRPFFTWEQASPIPDADGFAGSYAGVSKDVLIVAGGANFPGDKRPWTQGVKTWYDNIFVLEQKDGAWKEAGKLPRPMGYGISLTYKEGLLCLGGGDAQRNYADVFLLKYKAGRVETEYLPPMPAPLINACGVIVGDKVYVAGGIQTPAGLTENNFWSLDLAVPAAEKKWMVLEPL
ncbi:MAG: galactose oxidase, partial [Chitinophaga rupis]